MQPENHGFELYTHRIVVGKRKSYIFRYIVGIFFTAILLPVNWILFQERAILAFFISVISSIAFGLMIRNGWQINRLNKIFDVYAQGLLENNSFAVKDLAAYLKMPVIEVRKNLSLMADRGYFSKAYVESKTDELVIVLALGDQIRKWSQ